MNIVLLSGGSGKRLWPLSNDIRSKQFIKIFKNDKTGSYESMVQRAYRQIKKLDRNASITIATSKVQIPALNNQLGEDIHISDEPSRRDTFPAISLAVNYLVDILGKDPEEVVVVCPVDPYVEDEYYKAIAKLAEIAAEGTSNLVLLGMEPTSLSTDYGYIIPETKEEVSKVSSFKEKPNQRSCEEYIKQGALWNGGVFAFKIKYLLDLTHNMIDYEDYHDLYTNYDRLPALSFDYAVVEGEESINVLRFAGKWQDIGTWSALTEAMEETIVGNGTADETCEGVNILNETELPVLAMGLRDVIISVSPEGILVADKDQSSYIRPYIEGLEQQQVMFADKAWGSFKVLDVDKGGKTIKATLNAGHSMSYHSHRRRDEVWIVISGTGKTVVDGMHQSIKPGDVIAMSAGCRHTIIADTELVLIEVQIGRDISEQDKQLFELEY